MIVIQTNALIYFAAYGAFLVEAMLFYQNTTLTSAEPSHVFGIETVELLCQVDPGLKRITACAVPSEYQHSTHFVIWKKKFVVSRR